jgi:septal ring factor EnvC (AmiA/AmiB activator)
MKVERTRRALEQDLASARSFADRRLLLVRKLDKIADRTALEIEHESAARMSEPLDDADDTSRAFERALAGPASAADGVPSFSKGFEGRANRESPAEDAAEGFRGMKGRLPLPIVGRGEIRRVHRSGAPGPGLEFVAAPGTPVRAVFAGRVAFADRYDPRGSVVILEHGQHFYSLMGDLGSIDVRVGDDLSAGTRVGSVGGSGLYFEIRRGSAAVDPGPWLGF